MRRTAIEIGRGLEPRFLDALRDELLRLGGESLRDAVRELIFLGVLLDEDGRGELASPLFGLVESRAVIEALDRANARRVAESGEAVAEGARRFSRFAGEETGRSIKRPIPGMRLEDLGVQRFAGLRLR